MNGILYDWPTAARAARSGHFVRRRGWTTKWLRWVGGLWWMREDGEPERVVQAADFARDEFLARDWTHMPPECITDAETKTGQTCPAPFLPPDPGTIAEPDNTSGSGSGGGVSISTAYSLPGFAGGTQGSITPPPPQFAGETGGGVLGSKPGRADLVWPELSITGITDLTSVSCYTRGGDNDRGATFSGTIELSNPDNVVVGPYDVTIRVGGQIEWEGSLLAGGSATFSVTLRGTPGETSFQLEGRANGVPNVGDITDSASTPTMKPWCDESSGEPVGGP